MLLPSAPLSTFLLLSFFTQNGQSQHLDSYLTSSPFTTPSGPIQDTTCDVEHVEHANDSQLHTILQELRQTAFFRSFAVDLDHGCPLVSWNKRSKTSGEKKKTDGAEEKVSTTTKEEKGKETSSDEGSCEGDLPDFEDDSGGGACGVKDSGGFLGMGGGQSFGSGMSTMSTMSTMAPKEENENDGDGDESENSNENSDEKNEENSEKNSEKNSNENSDENSDEEDYSFSCGSDNEDGDEESDEDAEPLCHVSSLPPQATPIRDLFSSALRTISESIGWESESQRRTFSWKKPSNPVVTSPDPSSTAPCSDDPDIFPETFWMDMCSEITAGDGLRLVNLAMNPERNTGYNGTHIWKAIYDENCVHVDGSANSPMCYEERILYRLLSGLHASTTLSIATNYYPPSKRKKRETWEPNPMYFMDKFSNDPEFVNNLHFSYVVLLRALKKVGPFLKQYEIHTGNIVDDETATVLLQRLLESHILKSCSSVFSAFDESHFFKSTEVESEVISVKRNFKGVFHNISSILDCVQCQQCKLHGKMAMLGYGTALKILFSPERLLDETTLTRNEIVAFINTIAKFSESMKEIRELTHLYWKSKVNRVSDRVSQMDTLQPDTSDNLLPDTSDTSEILLEDRAMSVISQLSRSNKLTLSQETELVKLAMTKNPDMLILAKHYYTLPDKFLLHSQNLISLKGPLKASQPDVIVVGTGLAGLITTLQILDRGGTVTLIEKERTLGGNSAKASSGINAYISPSDTDIFQNDTTRSAGASAQLPLISTLVSNSASAVSFLQSRLGVDLSLIAQLGGHSAKRTHRPKNGMVGAEVVYAAGKAVKSYEKKGQLEILLQTKVVDLLMDDIADHKNTTVTGVKFQTANGVIDTRHAPHVVLATGGFASDRTQGSFLDQHRPELMRFPATAGGFSTGDGVRLAVGVGAGVVDMDKVQVHPTGWVDPKNPHDRNKVLAGELMRGVGGILLNATGDRFCNELGTRAYVTNAMLDHDPYHARHRKWNTTASVPTFTLLLSSTAALDGKKHVDMYSHKGLIAKIQGIDALAHHLSLDPSHLASTLRQYQNDSLTGKDTFGKTTFRNMFSNNLSEETFYVGTVTPVLHYCMGGLTIDPMGNVLRESDKSPIQGLHAAGEVSGGVHGANRLGGNSLLECTVFGTIVGGNIPIRDRGTLMMEGEQQRDSTTTTAAPEAQRRRITVTELAKHDKKDDCWVVVNGIVYDLTEFAEEHPPGPESIWRLGGRDGTDEFMAVHNEGILDDFQDVVMGVFDEDT